MPESQEPSAAAPEPTTSKDLGKRQKGKSKTRGKGKCTLAQKSFGGEEAEAPEFIDSSEEEDIPAPKKPDIFLESPQPTSEPLETGVSNINFCKIIECQFLLSALNFCLGTMCTMLKMYLIT